MPNQYQSETDLLICALRVSDMISCAEYLCNSGMEDSRRHIEAMVLAAGHLVRDLTDKLEKAEVHHG